MREITVQQMISKAKKPKGKKIRLLFVFDATASRERALRTGRAAQSKMISEIMKVASVSVRLAFFRSHDEFKVSKESGCPDYFARIMAAVQCEPGATQIGRALNYTLDNEFDAVVFVGDTVEECPDRLSVTASGQKAPWYFIADQATEKSFHTMAALAKQTGGACLKYDGEGAVATRLAAIFSAIGTNITGGKKALEADNSPAARLLLGAL